MNIRTKTFVLALSALFLGSGTTLIAVAAVPDDPGLDVPGYGRLPDGSRLPDETRVPGAPVRPDTSGPRVVPGRPGSSGEGISRTPNRDAQFYQEQERRYEEERDRNDAIQESIIGIDSDDSCMLRPANNTVAARGECTMGKSCIVQERLRNSSVAWRDSIGNPTPRQNGLEYRPFCR
jgi:hypothetical protein